MIVKAFATISFLLFGLSLKGQSTISGDSLLELHIIGDKVCVNKKGNLEFSYFFRNTSEENIVVIDYYEPCIWENPAYDVSKDSIQTFGLILEILDEQGNVIHPIRPGIGEDTVRAHLDSTTFFEGYLAENAEEYEYHTRVLRPQTSLINFFSLKINKRKCYRPGVFEWNRSRNYQVRLYYLTMPDARELMNHSMIRKVDVVFVGKVVSKEVSLCFE